MDVKQIPVLGVGGGEFLVLLHSYDADDVQWQFKEAIEADGRWSAVSADVPRWHAERIDIIQS